MKPLELKFVSGETMDVDTKTKSVKVALSRMGNLDSYNDIIEKGAFNKTLKERGPKGANMIWHLADHIPTLKSAFGKFKELYVEGDYLIGVSEYRDTPLWKTAMPLYEKGDINQHSIGFVATDWEMDKKGVRTIKEVKLYEGSTVLWGANSDTPTIQVMKSLTFDEQRDFVSDELDYIIKNIDRIDDDDIRSLFEIKLKQVQTLIKDFTSSTKAAVAAPSPEEVNETEQALLSLKLLTLKIN